MKHYIGLDVSMKQTSICIVDEGDHITFQKDVPTNPEVIFKTIQDKGLEIKLAGLESGSLSHWLVDNLNQLGLPTICVCSRKMAAVLSLTINKTDKNDAKGIASAIRAGYYREVHHKSQYAVELSTLMGARRSLVSQRTNTINTIRGLLKSYGMMMGQTSMHKFAENCEVLMSCLTKDAVVGIKALLDQFKTLHKQIIILEKKVDSYAWQDPVVTRLMTMPGIGPITALTYKMEIDDPHRFKKSRAVGAYIGLTPKQYSSGEIHRQGKISKCGSSELRYLLSEGATTALLRTKTWNKDKAWAFRIMKKHGFGKARTALARKMSVMMHRMWVEEKDYNWVDVKPEEVKILEKIRADKKKPKGKKQEKKQLIEEALAMKVE